MSALRRSRRAVASLPVVGVVARRRTYRNLALCLALFPVGVLNGTVFLTGLAMGLALLPVAIGVPVLGGVLVLVTWLAALYADLLSATTGVDIRYRRFTVGEAGLWDGLRALAGRPDPYVLLVVMLASFPVGVALFTAVVVVLTLGVVLLLAPVFAPLPVTTYGAPGGPALETPLELAGATLAGTLVLLGGLWGVTLAGEGILRVARAVTTLGGGGDGPADPRRDGTAQNR